VYELGAALNDSNLNDAEDGRPPTCFSSLAMRATRKPKAGQGS